MLWFGSADGTPSRTSPSRINRLGTKRRYLQIRSDPRLDAREIGETTAIERQFPHGALIHQRGNGRIRRLHQRSFPGHGDFVGDRADLKREVDDSLSPNGQRNAAAHDGFEPWRLGAYFIAAQRELGSPIASALVRSDSSRDPLLHAF